MELIIHEGRVSYLYGPMSISKRTKAEFDGHWSCPSLCLSTGTSEKTNDQDSYVYPDPCPYNSGVFTDMLLHAVYIISTSNIYEFCFPNAKSFV